MRESARNFAVGIASIGGLIGLSALMMSFGEIDPWLHPRYTIQIHTDNAAGLKPGGNVEFNGVPVGVVNTVSIGDDPRNPVVIELLINEDVRIPTDVELFATAPLIGGSALLRMESPAAAATTPDGPIDTYPTDGSADITGQIRGGMFDQLTAQLDERMKPILESLEKFNQLSDTFNDLGRNLNELVQPQSSEQLANGEAPNLRTAVEKLNAALDNATEGLALAKDWLGDEQIRGDVKQSVQRAKTLIDNATAAVDRYTRMAETLETSAQDITQRLLPVADQLAVTLEEVRGMVRKASEGQGTVGHLLNNPDLYNSLNDAAIRLERTLIDVQLLLQKFKAEGVNINF